MTQHVLIIKVNYAGNFNIKNSKYHYVLIVFDNALYSGDVVLFCNFKLINAGIIEQTLKAQKVESSTDMLTQQHFKWDDNTGD